MALLELADAAPIGTGERPLLVAEELALEELLGDGGAVDGDERRRRARAVLVDGAGDELLAGAALAGDEDGHVLRGDAADGLVDLEHRGVGAEERPLLGGLERGLGPDRDLGHPRRVERLRDHPLQVRHVGRLL